MKLRLLYVSFLTIPFCLALSLSNKEGPQEKIIGKWKEESWKYEKMDIASKGELSWFQEIDDRIKREISNHLIIHQAEEWNFQPNYQLELYSDSGETATSGWKLKGRGNVLELKSIDGKSEAYMIQELTSSRMVLHFNSDLQTRGIVEMIFTRID